MTNRFRRFTTPSRAIRPPTRPSRGERTNHRFVPDSKRNRPEPGWLVRAIIAGFFATSLMTAVLALAYGFVVLAGSGDPAAPTLLRWFWALAHNPITQRAQTALPVTVLLHFVAGLAWAVAYAGLAEPRLLGPGWRRGLLFAPAPGFLSLLVFLPLLGGGVFGLQLGAGPLPILGNLTLHLVYGGALGTLYPEASNRVLVVSGEASDPSEGPILAEAERDLAAGVVVGLIAGVAVGALGQRVLVPGEVSWLPAMVGGIVGSASGALIGSFVGLSPRPG